MVQNSGMVFYSHVHEDTTLFFVFFDLMLYHKKKFYSTILPRTYNTRALSLFSMHSGGAAVATNSSKSIFYSYLKSSIFRFNNL